MRGAAMMGVVQLGIYYLIGWLVHTAVFASLFAALDKVNPELLRRKRVQLEFWFSALAAICAVAVPVIWIWVSSGFIHIVLAVVICIVSLFMGYRRLREKAIDPQIVRGDALGYCLSLIVWGGLYFLRR